MLGDVSGLSILDLGCGNGAKLAELAADGATECVGVDVSGHFIDDHPNGWTLVQGDINALDSLEAVRGRQFNRILFLQSFGYATDPVATLRQAVRLLAEDGIILLTRTHPVRYAVERAERNGTSLGEEYYARGSWSGDSRWGSGISLTKRTYTVADLLNVFGQAGLWIEGAAEPEFPEAARRRFPHKAAWMDKHLGILIFRLRPVLVR
jgi:SAM-dependent methyltransferase